MQWASTYARDLKEMLKHLLQVPCVCAPTILPSKKKSFGSPLDFNDDDKIRLSKLN